MDDIPTTSSTPPSPQAAPSKKRLLIVEDDFFIRDLYELQARKSGFEVVTASDGEEAYLKAKSQPFDILLIDLMLPKIDGITLTRTLKADPKMVGIPFVIVTNLEDPSKEQEARNAGAVEYLLKIKNTPQTIIDSLTTYLK
ncbi:MAG: response regulator [Candidatus Daviesbacteria bacterium]